MSNAYLTVNGRVYVNKPEKVGLFNKSHAFKKIKCKTESHRLSFYLRTIEQWKSLPENIISQVISIPNIKTQISKHAK